MIYADFLRPSEGFQYSINLQYDLGNNNKVRGYIPTINTIEVLKSYLRVIYDGTGDKSTVLVGPYGKGKSHLLLILLTLLQNKPENKDAILELIEKISRIDESTAQLCRMIIESDIKLLPIIINSNYNDLHQSFLIALNDAFKRNNLSDLMPATYFDSVLSVISKWKSDFPDVINVLKNSLKENGLTLTELEDGLKKYDKRSYEIFKKVYLNISSGIEYNPFVNSDVVRLYDETNFLLCEKYGYSGMFIVFDEFSKFMEASVSNNASKDIKVLQDFAELADRTSNKQQLHLACITHKTINEYVSKLPKESINAWRGIEGRFKEKYLTSSSKQNYELISNAIIKDKIILEKFVDENMLFNKISNSYELFRDSFNENEYKDNIVLGCFPLNPMVTFSLPKISEKVAQNERTLFTFLCKNETHTLTEFINKNNGKLKLLNLDVIFDYFRNLFKKEVFNESVHEVWLKADAAIRKCQIAFEKRILKAIGIIYIINEFDKLPPTLETLKDALDVSKEELLKYISPMIENNIIYLKRSNGHVNFVPIAHTNIRQRIDLIKNTKVKNVNLSEELEKIYNLGYVLPKRYNDEFKMVRFFKNIYLNVQQLEAYDDSKSLIDDYQSDGVIVNLVYFDESEKERAIEKVRFFDSGRIILCMPSEPFNKIDAINEYVAIRYLKNDKSFIEDEPLILQLIEIIEEDLIEDIKMYLEKSYIPENKECSYFALGDNLKIFKRSDLNKKVSEICLMYFDRTPKINNEMINKNNITTVISKAREKVIQYLIESYKNDSIESISGNGPDATIYKVLIQKFDLDKSSYSNDCNLNNVLNKIREFVISSEDNRRSFKELYDALTGERIGLRRGVIPIYLAYVFREFKEDLVIYLGVRGNRELDLNNDTLKNINDNPKEYYLKIEKGTKEKEQFIDLLSGLFSNEINMKQFKANRFAAIGSAMQIYIQSLSQYTRTHREDLQDNNLKSSIVNFRSELLKFDLNFRDFIFNKLLKITGCKDYTQCFEEIKFIKKYLDSSLDELRGFLIKEVNEIVCKEYKGSLTQNLKRWFEDLDEEKKNHLYDVTTNNILKFISNLNTNNDTHVLNKIASIVTGLNIEDWQNKNIKSFIDDFTKCLNEVNKIEIDVTDDGQSLFKIEINQKGLVTEKNFEAKEVSEIGLTMLNDIEEILDEYAESIETNEKRNILMKLLQKYM